MAWRPVSEWPTDHQLEREGRFWEERYVYFSANDKAGKPYERIAGPTLPTPWIEHAHSANATMITHWWDGDGKPTLPPGRNITIKGAAYDY